MSRFELLVACIRAGQLSPKQIAAEMRDPAFAAYWRQRAGGINWQAAGPKKK